MRNCDNCAYNKGPTCQIMRVKLLNCWAWADEEEKDKREEAVKEYSKKFELEDMSKYATSKEKLETNFLTLYVQGYYDTDIAEKLGVHPSTVGDYRRKLGLPFYNKKKPARKGK